MSTVSIAPVVLAAGDSRRMGYPKALLPLGDEAFLTRILRVLRDSGLNPPLIVLGRAAEQILPLMEGWQADIRINPDPGRGQLSSIQIALEHIDENCEGALVWPVDQPAVSGELVRGLTALFAASRPMIACPVVGVRRGHPVIFHRELFRELRETPLAEGAQKVVWAHRKDTQFLPTSESAAVTDIDTPSDYREWTGESLEAALVRVSGWRIRAPGAVRKTR